MPKDAPRARRAQPHAANAVEKAVIESVSQYENGTRIGTVIELVLCGPGFAHRFRFPLGYAVSVGRALNIEAALATKPAEFGERSPRLIEPGRTPKGGDE